MLYTTEDSNENRYCLEKFTQFLEQFPTVDFPCYCQQTSNFFLMATKMTIQGT